MVGISQYYLGNLASARHDLERVLFASGVSENRTPVFLEINRHVTALAVLARVLWLQGYADQAKRAAANSVEEALASNHSMSLCYALDMACPIALLIGDLGAAGDYVKMLLDHSSKHGLARWGAQGRCYKGVLAVKRGEIGDGLSLLQTGWDERGEAFSVLRIAILMAEALGCAGRVEDGLAVVEEMIKRSEEPWVVADAGLLCSKGELLLFQGAPGAAAAAEVHFRQALDCSRRQGALSWELRAATGLARLWCDQGRPAEGMALLQPVYDRFTEGFDTTDLKAAKALLDLLAEPNPLQGRIS